MTPWPSLLAPQHPEGTPPTARWCTRTLNKPTSSLSIRGWRMSSCHAGATTRGFIPMAEEISREGAPRRLGEIRIGKGKLKGSAPAVNLCTRHFGDGFASPPPERLSRRWCTPPTSHLHGCPTPYHRLSASCSQSVGDWRRDGKDKARQGLVTQRRGLGGEGGPRSLKVLSAVRGGPQRVPALPAAGRRGQGGTSGKRKDKS
jgi:hypothetical protein